MTIEPTLPPEPIKHVVVARVRFARPLAWRVEAHDTNGGVQVNIFRGGDVKKRAIEYAAWKYNYTYAELPSPK